MEAGRLAACLSVCLCVLHMQLEGPGGWREHSGRALGLYLLHFLLSDD